MRYAFLLLLLPAAACASYNPSAGGGGGGAGFSLLVTTGGAAGFTGVPISSFNTTTDIVFDSNTTNGSLQGSNTYFFTLSPSSVTLKSSHVVTFSTSSHILTTGPAPNLINCGSNPSVTGDDNEGLISVGGGLPSACVLQFAANWGVKPACVATPSTTIAISLSVTSSTSTTFSFGSPPGGIYYHCQCSGSGCF